MPPVETPFMTFWRLLNEFNKVNGADDLLFGDAKELWEHVSRRSVEIGRANQRKRVLKLVDKEN